jgi:Zn-dependent peptidase ImmA (M78 family)
MNLTRMDLDGTGSPHGLVEKILQAVPDLPIPVPIEELAHQLDILEINDLETDAFEGGLLTDDCKSNGIILVNRAARGGRRRFTIGHELAHFLIPTHKPVKNDRFLCSREDMRCWSAKENDTYARMEVEANKFSALILMPPPKLRPMINRLGDPNLAHVLDVARHFDVSKDSAARAYAEHHDGQVAIAIVKDGVVLRIYRHLKFPKVGIANGMRVPQASLFHHAAARRRQPSEILENNAGLWLESDWGKPLPNLYEQVLFQQEGYALILLWPEFPDEEEEDRDEDRTAKERYRDRKAAWQR